MTEVSFFDTNVLVYARDPYELGKQTVSADLVSDAWRTGLGRISTQVLNEFYVTVTRKLQPGMSPEDAWVDVASLTAWNPAPTDVESLHVARHVQTRYRLSWWDSLVVATAHIAGATTILTENLQHGAAYLGLRAVNPFLLSTAT